MRNALPTYGKLSRESSECMQECVSEFISFITSQAAEKCSLERRKTLNGEDILFSMYTLGFENYAETLKIYLAKYREFELDESEARRRKYKARKEKKRLEQQAKQSKQPGQDQHIYNDKEEDDDDSGDLDDQQPDDQQREHTDTELYQLPESTDAPLDPPIDSTAMDSPHTDQANDGMFGLMHDTDTDKEDETEFTTDFFG